MLATGFEVSERYHPRVEANFMVKLMINGRTLLAKAEDLSMAGVRLAGGTSVDRDRLTVALPLPGDREVIVGCTVQRDSDDAVALKFDQLDWDDLFALARFLHPRLP